MRNRETRRRELERQTTAIQLVGRIRRGIAAAKRDRRKLLTLLACPVVLLGLWLLRHPVMGYTAESALAPLYDVLTGMLLVLLGGAVPITLLGVWGGPIQAGFVQDSLYRAGIVNSIGEAPTLVSMEKDPENPGIWVFEFSSSGIPLTKYEDLQQEIESAMNKRITKIEEGADPQSVRLHLAPGSLKLLEEIPFPNARYFGPSVVALGESLLGTVTADLNKNPHILVGGSTGCGKTTMLVCIVRQLLQKWMNAEVTLIDLKGGQDYPPAWRGRQCAFADNAQEALRLLSDTVEELERRKVMFQQTSEYIGAGCSCLDDYNTVTGLRLPRRAVIIDEIAELTDTDGMDKPHKELAAAIVRSLSTIARLGRAFGITLVVGVQRPDATVLPGQIKNNMLYRVCGKADEVMSRIILDSAEAANKIPKDSRGLFLNQDGVLFRGYKVEKEEP